MSLLQRDKRAAKTRVREKSATSYKIKVRLRSRSGNTNRSQSIRENPTRPDPHPKPNRNRNRALELISATMASTAPQLPTAAAASRKDDAAEVLRMVLGEGIVSALNEGFAKGGDFTDVIPLLVAAGARPHLAAAARAAVATACDGGRAGAAALLLAADGVRPEDAGAESTYTDEEGEGGYPLLHAATLRGDAAVVRALVGSGKADVNADGSGCGFMQPLRIAAEKGHADCLRVLLAADGIQANAPDAEDYTALMDAVVYENAECVRMLLADIRVDVNHTSSEDGWTALGLAVDGNNQPETVRALVGHGGVDLGFASMFYGWTALHYACKENNAETASLLLVAGSCRFALTAAAPGGTAMRRTPLDLAGDSKEGQAVRALFLSGIDYWQRRRHAAHARAMRDVVLAVMLVRQRLDAAPQTAVAAAAAAHTLVHLPEEIWLLMCGFLRSADFRRP